MKPSIQFKKNAEDLWGWQIYNETGEEIAVSTASYETRDESEQDAAITMTAIIEDSLRALTVTDNVRRMKPVLEAIILSAGKAVATMREMGYYNDRGLTAKGGKLVEDMVRQRLGWEQRDIELSKALPPIEGRMQIPVQYSDKPQKIIVRVK